MVKTIGIILAIVSCTAMGLLKSSELTRRRELLLDFKHLLLRISTEIGYFKEPLPRIFEQLSADGQDGQDSWEAGTAGEETGLLLRSCLTGYLTENTQMSKCWKNAVDFVYDGLPLTKADKDIMKKCGDFLGQSDFSGQQNHFALVGEQLDRQIEQAAEDIKTKGKMYSRLGLAADCIIAVVLI